MLQTWELMPKKPKQKPKKKSIAETLDDYLRFSIFMVIVYTITAIAFQGLTGDELSTALTAGVYGFFGTEIGAAAFIKINKIKKEDV